MSGLSETARLKRSKGAKGLLYGDFAQAQYIIADHIARFRLKAHVLSDWGPDRSRRTLSAAAQEMLGSGAQAQGSDASTVLGRCVAGELRRWQRFPDLGCY